MWPISAPSISSLAKSPGRGARPSSLDLDPFGDQFAEHVSHVVVAGWCFLAATRSCYPVGEQEEVYRNTGQKREPG